MAEQGHDNPIYTMADTFRLVADAHQQAQRIAESAKETVRQFYRDPKQLAIFIERHQTPVYVLKNSLFSSFCLWILGFEPGFIAPSFSKKYQRLVKLLSASLLASVLGRQSDRPHCHFEHGVFILTPTLFTVGYLSHQLHHWLAFRSGMQGYSERAQKLYKKFWNEQNGTLGAEVEEMSVEDILALKAAINRDMEALQFLKEVASEILIPAKQAKRLSHGTASA